MDDRDKAIEKMLEQLDAAKKRALEKLPKPGSKLRYRGNPIHWITNIVNNAERELRIGEIYTLKSIELGRSWCLVTLKETGETQYSLAFFDIFSESEQKFKRRV